jgi:hypothetical protein
MNDIEEDIEAKALRSLIISKPKPDPLVEVWDELLENSYDLHEFVAALEAHGLEIREKNDD